MTNDMKPHGVILDFDGVIADSLSLHLEAWANATLQVFGVPLERPEELIGHATRTIASILAKKHGDPSLASSLVRIKELNLADRLSSLPLIVGARDFIHDLIEAQLPFGIASNSRRNFVHAALHASALKVEHVVCGDEISRPKPKPDIYWECARRIGISKSHYDKVLVFEDSVHGIKAAVSAGMAPIGVTSQLAGEKLLKAGAKTVCQNLAEARSKNWIFSFPKDSK